MATAVVHYTAAARTDRGRKRGSNEDAYGFSDRYLYQSDETHDLGDAPEPVGELEAGTGTEEGADDSEQEAASAEAVDLETTDPETVSAHGETTSSELAGEGETPDDAEQSGPTTG